VSPNSNSVLLVGSVPLEDSEAVLSTCGAVIGDYVAALPDGEPHDRSIWINFLALRTYYMHPQLESVNRPAPIGGVEQWIPTSPTDHWQFKIKPGVTDLRFDDLRYAGAALSSYLTFKQLKHEGVIPEHVRFQVCLPLTWSGTMMFFMAHPEDLEQVVPAFERALIREIEKIALAIPAEELAIQWDVCIEILDVDGAFPFSPPGDKLERFLECCRHLAHHVPEGALMGYHLCYADLNHRHIQEPKDLETSVRMANGAVEASRRRVDFFHFAVPRDRSDDGYFKPLEGLDVGDARVYLGLVHMTDGAEGTRRRIETAKRYLPDFGIATECGFGRRPAEQVRPLLELHVEVASELAAATA
jgi:hypothetical protein